MNETAKPTQNWPYGPALNRHDLAHVAAVLATSDLRDILPGLHPTGRFWHLYDILCAEQRRREAEKGAYW